MADAGKGKREAPGVPLASGDHAPWFRAAALSGSPTYQFDTVAGRHVLLLFIGSAKHEAMRHALAVVARERALFDDETACFFGITVDPQDAEAGRIVQQLPGVRFFLDFDRKVSALYGAIDGERYRPHWLLLDPGLRVVGRFAADQGEQAVEAQAHIDGLGAEPEFDGG